MQNPHVQRAASAHGSATCKYREDILEEALPQVQGVCPVGHGMERDPIRASAVPVRVGACAQNARRKNLGVTCVARQLRVGCQSLRGEGDVKGRGCETSRQACPGGLRHLDHPVHARCRRREHPAEPTAAWLVRVDLRKHCRKVFNRSPDLHQALRARLHEGRAVAHEQQVVHGPEIVRVRNCAGVKDGELLYIAHTGPLRFCLPMRACKSEAGQGEGCQARGNDRLPRTRKAGSVRPRAR
mmetsp:Transcript_27095/g.73522  ORF Transcript_27095/g.73522 Transcript_27095/m.73522 type:complete len:241 (+) Transcript_27095:628-1350(+)